MFKHIIFCVNKTNLRKKIKFNENQNLLCVKFSNYYPKSKSFIFNFYFFFIFFYDFLVND